VRAFDVAPRPETLDGVEWREGDVTRAADAASACVGIDTVFHTAAVLNFLSFPTSAERRLAESVNVGGVERMLHAARAAGVKRFVYTSTNNVAFDRAPVIDGDENSPTAEKARDLYTATKLRAEKLTRAAHDDAGLRTCAIRPGGIFGPGERHFLPVLVDRCARGRFDFVLGDGRAVSDTTFIENLIDGHVQAARHLVPGSPLGGQAYFITDGVPVNYFEFFRPMIEGMGFRYPRWNLPVAPILGALWAWEWLHGTFGLPAPPITVLEVRKASVTHHFGIEKARRDFGWVPKVGPEEVAARCLAYCRQMLSRRCP
jgi:3beta-hydroxy-delta5-steroid dehydrogenase/steroid delta-isomerase